MVLRGALPLPAPAGLGLGPVFCSFGDCSLSGCLPLELFLQPFWVELDFSLMW